jgi:hypothetical protein
MTESRFPDPEDEAFNEIERSQATQGGGEGDYASH